MALAGISNANEFYSAHYLESVLAGDIKKVRERWSEEAKAQLESDPGADVSTPDAAFRALRKPWQKLREAELGITDHPAERLRLQRQLFFQPLCEVLGYPGAGGGSMGVRGGQGRSPDWPTLRLRPGRHLAPAPPPNQAPSGRRQRP
jgi:hypothetical protein